MPSDEPPEFNEIISDERNIEGRYSCPICWKYDSDSVRSVQGHISGSRDEEHEDFGWNHKEEIIETAMNL